MRIQAILSFIATLLTTALFASSVIGGEIPFQVLRNDNDPGLRYFGGGFFSTHWEIGNTSEGYLQLEMHRTATNPSTHWVSMTPRNGFYTALGSARAEWIGASNESITVTVIADYLSGPSASMSQTVSSSSGGIDFDLSAFGENVRSLTFTTPHSESLNHRTIFINEIQAGYVYATDPPDDDPPKKEFTHWYYTGIGVNWSETSTTPLGGTDGLNGARTVTITQGGFERMVRAHRAASDLNAGKVAGSSGIELGDATGLPSTELQKFVNAMYRYREEILPDDVLVIHITTHGCFQLEFLNVTNGPEPIGEIRPGPDFPDGGFETGNEGLLLTDSSIQQQFFSDDGFKELFTGEIIGNIHGTTWDQVNKLFVLELCFGGGFTRQEDIIGDGKSAYVTSTPGGYLPWDYTTLVDRDLQFETVGIGRLGRAVDDIFSQYSTESILPSSNSEFQQRLLARWAEAYQAGDGKNIFLAQDFDFSSENTAWDPQFGDLIPNVIFENGFTFGETVILGDVNQDGTLDLLDVAPFVNLILDGVFQTEADINQDDVVDLLDVAPFVELLTSS